MSIITDGPRSARWVALAKQKLAQIKEMGIPAKVLQIKGYLIRLSQSDGIDKINITAPAVGVVSHIEYPSEYVYYAEPFGAAAAKLGPVGARLGAFNIVRVVVGDSYAAPGYGAIFSSTHDLYSKSEGFYNYFIGAQVTSSLAYFQTMFADNAKNDLATTGSPGEYARPGAAGAWLVSVGVTVFATAINTVGTGSNLLNVFAYPQNGTPIHVAFDLDSAEVRAATGVPVHLRAGNAHIYQSTVSGKARLAVFADAVGGTNSGAEKDLYNGVYFFDWVLNPPSNGNGASLSWNFVGVSRTYPLGGRWTLEGVLSRVFMSTGGPVVNTSAQQHKSCTYSDGSGGVRSTIFRGPLDTNVKGEFRFTPGAIAVSVPGAAFPPEITDVQVWPLIFRGVDTYLCAMEKVTNSGPATEPLTSIVALYKGSTATWAPVPLPTDTLIAVRPVYISAARTALLGVIWVAGSGSYYATFDDASASTWNILGKLSDTRMVRPIVGIFGKHAYAKFAQDFQGSFPLTSWAGANTYSDGTA